MVPPCGGYLTALVQGGFQGHGFLPSIRRAVAGHDGQVDAGGGVRLMIALLTRISESTCLFTVASRACRCTSSTASWTPCSSAWPCGTTETSSQAITAAATNANCPSPSRCWAIPRCCTSTSLRPAWTLTADGVHPPSRDVDELYSNCFLSIKVHVGFDFSAVKEPCGE